MKRNSWLEEFELDKNNLNENYSKDSTKDYDISKFI